MAAMIATERRLRTRMPGRGLSRWVLAEIGHSPRVGRTIGRGIGHSEEDDDLTAWLALESATMFLHGLVAGWAARRHWPTVSDGPIADPQYGRLATSCF